MTRKERYRADPVYRAKVNQENRERYHRRMKDTQFAKLCATRARINNARAAIAHHEGKLAFFYSRIERDLNLLRKLTQKREGVNLF